MDQYRRQQAAVSYPEQVMRGKGCAIVQPERTRRHAENDRHLLSGDVGALWHAAYERSARTVTASSVGDRESGKQDA